MTRDGRATSLALLQTRPYRVFEVGGVYVRTVVFYGLLAVMAAFCLLPIVWAVLTSFKTEGEIFRLPPTVFPQRPTLANYAFDLSILSFPRNVWKSLVVAMSTTVLCLPVGTCCAYALARLHFPGRAVVQGVILATIAFPTITIVNPLFVELKTVGWLNTYQGLVVPYLTFSLPLASWWLTAVFRELPRKLEEAALVDGCTHVGVLWRVIAPLSVSALVTAGILVFINAWQELPLALIVSVDDTVRTVPPALIYVFGGVIAPWGPLMAAIVIVTAPVIGLVVVFQRRIITGIASGAIKG